MLNPQTGIDFLKNLKRQTGSYLQRLHKTGEPFVLTVNGKAEFVGQDAAANQRLVEVITNTVRVPCQEPFSGSGWNETAPPTAC